jgi:hypothetical protein
MSHKTTAQVPLYSQYLEARIDTLEDRVRKLSAIFKMMLELDDEEEDEEDDDDEDCVGKFF